MEGNDYIVPIFHTAFGKILGVFRAEGVYGTIVCLEGDGVGGTADDGSGYSERNMFVINGVRVFSCYGDDADGFQRICLQVSDVCDIHVRAGSDSAFKIGGDCGHIQVECGVASSR